MSVSLLCLHIYRTYWFPVQDIAAHRKAVSHADKIAKCNFLGPAFACQYEALLRKTGSSTGSMMVKSDIASEGDHFLHRDKGTQPAPSIVWCAQKPAPLCRDLEEDVFHVGLQFHPGIHLQLSSINTTHAHSLLWGGPFILPWAIHISGTQPCHSVNRQWGSLAGGLIKICHSRLKRLRLKGEVSIVKPHRVLTTWV